MPESNYRRAGTLKPIPACYWVLPGRLLAGEYPGAKDGADAHRRLHHFLAAGITLFLDLTREWESGLVPYELALREEATAVQRAAELGLAVEYRRMTIADLDVPSVPFMRQILDTLDEALQAGHVVYVHCWGGIGRTGTVVGCYLVRHGFTGEEALQKIACWVAGTPKAHRPSPETAEQWRMVLDWSKLVQI